jgi:hypothetical protein
MAIIYADEEQEEAGINYGIDTIIPEDKQKEFFIQDWMRREKRGNGEAIWAFTKHVPEGLEGFAEEASEAWNEGSLISSMLGFGEEEGEASEAWRTLLRSPELGARDTFNSFKAIIGNIKDHFNNDLSLEERAERGWERHKKELDYNQVAREAFIKATTNKFQKKLSFLADVTDATNVLPSAFALKGGSKAVRGLAKGGVGATGYALDGVGNGLVKISDALGLPKKLSEKAKVGGGYSVLQGASIAGTLGGVTTPIVAPIAGAIATSYAGEVLTKIAGKTAQEFGTIAKIFSQPSSHSRFLHRLATSDKVSKATRKSASALYKMKGTQLYDIAFDSFVAGLGAGAMQIGMEGLKGKSAEDVGYATGMGIGFGSPVGLAGQRGSGKSKADYNPDGSMSDRSLQGIDNYIVKKQRLGDQETIKAIKGLEDDSLIALSTLDETAELGNFRMMLASQDLIVDAINKSRSVDIEVPKVKVGRVPPAMYDQKSRTIYINKDQIKEGTQIASNIFLHEHGHHAMRELLGSAPMTRRAILEGFSDEGGTEFSYKDENGKSIGSIKVNDEAFQFAKDYATKILPSLPDVAHALGFTGKLDAQGNLVDIEYNGDGDAGLLSEEIGAEQWSIATQENPNAFEGMNKSIRHSLFSAMKTALTKMGVLEPKSGKGVSSVISKAMLKNDNVKKVFDNYVKEKAKHLGERSDAIEKGRKHSPEEGQKSDERFTQLFGGVGVNLAVASHFHVKDTEQYNQLLEADKLRNEGENPSSFTGIGKGNEGKNLHWKTRQVFGMSGKYNNSVTSIIDMLQSAIDGRKMLKFGYRSASFLKKSDYNAFFERSVTPYAWQISPKKPYNRLGRTIYPNLKVMAYDADVVESNIEIMAHAGLLPDGQSVSDFKQAFAQHAQNVLTEVGDEGRINPLGHGENELFTMAMGMKESGERIIDPARNEWFSDPERNKMKNAFKSYDISALAGLSSQNRDGYAYDYKNAKFNYMPMLSGDGSNQSTIPPKKKKYVTQRQTDGFIALPSAFDQYTNKEIETILQDPESDFNIEGESLNESLIEWALNPHENQRDQVDRIGSFLIGATKGNEDIFANQKLDFKSLQDNESGTQTRKQQLDNLGLELENVLSDYSGISVTPELLWKEDDDEAYGVRYKIKDNNTENQHILGNKGTASFSVNIMKQVYQDAKITLPQPPFIIRLDTSNLGKMGMGKLDNTSVFSGKKIYQALYDFSDKVGIPIVHMDLSSVNDLRTASARLSQLLKSKNKNHITFHKKKGDGAYGANELSNYSFNQYYDDDQILTNDINSDSYVRLITAFALRERDEVRMKIQEVHSSSISPDLVFDLEDLNPAGKVDGEGESVYFNLLDAFRYDFDTGNFMAIDHRPKSDVRKEYQIFPKAKATRDETIKWYSDPQNDHLIHPLMRKVEGEKRFGLVKYLLNYGGLEEGVGETTFKRAIITNTIKRAVEENSSFAIRRGAHNLKTNNETYQRRKLDDSLFFLPELPTFQENGITYTIPLPPKNLLGKNGKRKFGERIYHGSASEYQYPDLKKVGQTTGNSGFLGLGYYGHVEPSDTENYGENIYSFEKLPDNEFLKSHNSINTQHPDIINKLDKLFDSRIKGQEQSLAQVWNRFYTKNKTNFIDPFNGKEIESINILPEWNENNAITLYHGLVNIYNPEKQKTIHLDKSFDFKKNSEPFLVVNHILGLAGIHGQESPTNMYGSYIDHSSEFVVFDAYHLRDFKREQASQIHFMPEPSWSAGVKDGKLDMDVTKMSRADIDLLMDADKEFQEKGYNSKYFKEWHQGGLLTQKDSAEPIVLIHGHSERMTERGNFNEEIGDQTHRYGSIQAFFTDRQERVGRGSNMSPKNNESTFVIKGKKMWDTDNPMHQNLISEWWRDMPLEDRQQYIGTSFNGVNLPDVIDSIIWKWRNHSPSSRYKKTRLPNLVSYLTKLFEGDKVLNDGTGRLDTPEGRFLESITDKSFTEKINKAFIESRREESDALANLPPKAMEEIVMQGYHESGVNWNLFESPSSIETNISDPSKTTDNSINTYLHKKHGFDLFRMHEEYGGRTYAVVDANAQAKIWGDEGDLKRQEFTFSNEGSILAMPYTMLTDDTAQHFDDLIVDMRKNPYGFTIDQSNLIHAKTGYVVAPEKETEFIIPSQEMNRTALWNYIKTHAHRFKKDGAHLGGWLSDQRGFMLDVAFPVNNYLDAVRMAIWGDQDSIYDIETQTEIKTRKDGELSVPENFPISTEEVRGQAPENALAFANARWRNKGIVRHESIESDSGQISDEVRNSMINSLNFMPSVPSEVMSKDTKMNFPMLSYDNEKTEIGLTKNSKNWTQSHWNQYFADNALADAMMKKLGKRYATPENWEKIHQLRLNSVSSFEIPAPPTKFLDYVNNIDQLVDWLDSTMATNPEFIELAKEGYQSATALHKIVKPPEMIAQSFIWGLLSRMLDPYNQEAGWLRTTNYKPMWNAIFQSIDGNYEMEKGTFYDMSSIADEKYGDGWRTQKGYKDFDVKIAEMQLDIEPKIDFRSVAESSSLYIEALKLEVPKAKLNKLRTRIVNQLKKKEKKRVDKAKEKITAIGKQKKAYIESRIKKLPKKERVAFASEAERRNIYDQPDTFTDIVANMFNDQKSPVSAGNNAKQNIQAIHDMLVKWNGRWKELTGIFNDKSLNGQQIREKMWSNGFLGAGVKDKVTSFVIALMADPNVVIMDRWQFVNVWEHQIQGAVQNRLQKVNEILADPEASKSAKDFAEKQKKEYVKFGVSPYRVDAKGVPEDRSGYYKTIGSQLDDPVEHAMYRTLEYMFSDLAKQVGKKRQDYAWIDSAFAMHWVTWNMIKKEAVGHSSFDILGELAIAGKFPATSADRDAFVDDFMGRPKYTEKNERLPKQQKTRRTRFVQDAYGKPIEEIKETNLEGEENIYFKGV